MDCRAPIEHGSSMNDCEMKVARPNGLALRKDEACLAAVDSPTQALWKKNAAKFAPTRGRQKKIQAVVHRRNKNATHGNMVRYGRRRLLVR